MTQESLLTVLIVTGAWVVLAQLTGNEDLGV